MREFFRLLIFLFALSGCSSSFEAANQVPDPVLNLQWAKAKWAEKGLRTYHLALDYPGAFGTSTVVTRVEDSAPASCVVIYSESVPSTPCSIADAETVDGLFTKIEQGLASGQLVEATYDNEFGVPTKIYIRGASPAMADGVSGYFTLIEFHYPIP